MGDLEEEKRRSTVLNEALRATLREPITQISKRSIGSSTKEYLVRKSQGSIGSSMVKPSSIKKSSTAPEHDLLAQPDTVSREVLDLGHPTQNVSYRSPISTFVPEGVLCETCAEARGCVICGTTLGEPRKNSSTENAIGLQSPLYGRTRGTSARRNEAMRASTNMLECPNCKWQSITKWLPPPLPHAQVFTPASASRDNESAPSRARPCSRPMISSKDSADTTGETAKIASNKELAGKYEYATRSQPTAAPRYESRDASAKNDGLTIPGTSGVTKGQEPLTRESIRDSFEKIDPEDDFVHATLRHTDYAKKSTYELNLVSGDMHSPKLRGYSRSSSEPHAIARSFPVEQERVDSRLRPFASVNSHRKPKSYATTLNLDTDKMNPNLGSVPTYDTHSRTLR